MSECSLRCNNIVCRQALSRAESACITKCSHIFCMQCATASFSSSPKCPACQVTMDTASDIMTVTLKVTENYKSLILAGLPPLVIMDICSRALSFWSYQAFQELRFQQASSEALREKIMHIQSRESIAVNKASEKLKIAESKLSSLQSALHTERQERSLAEDTIEEKNRQLRGLKLAYENIRQKHAALAHQSSHSESLSDRMPTLMRSFDNRRKQAAFRINNSIIPGLAGAEHQSQECIAWQTKQQLRGFSTAQSSHNSTSWSF